MKINWLALEIELEAQRNGAIDLLSQTMNLSAWLARRNERRSPETLSYRSREFDAELGFRDAYALGKFAAQANAKAKKLAAVATTTDNPEYVERVNALRLLDVLAATKRDVYGETTNPDDRRDLEEQVKEGIAELAAEFAEELGAADEESARAAVAADVDVWLELM